MATMAEGREVLKLTRKTTQSAGTSRPVLTLKRRRVDPDAAATQPETQPAAKAKPVVKPAPKPAAKAKPVVKPAAKPAAKAKKAEPAAETKLIVKKIEKAVKAPPPPQEVRTGPTAADKRRMCEAKLIEHWPDTFKQTKYNRRPLRVGIQPLLVQDAEARNLDITPNEIRVGLSRYTGQLSYQIAIQNCVYRVGLQGEDCEPVKESEKEQAQVKVKDLTARRVRQRAVNTAAK